MEETKLSSGDLQTVLNQAYRLLDAKRWQEAHAMLAQHQQEVSATARGCFAFGICAIGQSDYSTGQTWMKACLALDPTHAEARYYLGDLLRSAGDYQSAMVELNQVIKQQPNHAAAYFSLGRTLYNMDRLALALSAYQQALAINPNLYQIDSHVANCYMALGHKDQARHYATLAAQKYPDDASILYNHALAHHHALDNTQLTHLHSRLDQFDEDHEEKAFLAYALAGVYEKRKQPGDAFTYYAEANRILGALTHYSQEQFDAEMDEYQAVIANWEQKDFSQHGHNEKGPIFIVGMPRSGTTLIEQILSAHSMVTGAGELAILRSLALTPTKQFTGKEHPFSLDALTPQQTQQLGAAYMKALRSYGNSPHVTDKMPGNWFHIPLIRLILPNAIIIQAMRDPIDTCWSIWRQYFPSGHFYRFDFETLAAHYYSYHRAMEHWKQMFPGRIHTVSYEALVSDPEAQTRTLIDACGLPWEDACLNYHQQTQQIRTASMQQANQPIYTSSVKSWQPVAQQLQPLIDALHNHGIEV